MSAPTTHDPLVVNTTDGVTWLRRAVTQDGRGLYAVTDSCKCPEYLMATLTELEGHGIVGSADVLPVPVGPDPQAMSLPLSVVAELNDLRTRLAGMANPPRELFLGLYDGAEPELFTTAEAAREYCDDLAPTDAYGKGWDWTVNEHGVHVQFWTHPDDDRPLSETSGSVTPIVVQGVEPVSELERLRARLVELEAAAYGDAEVRLLAPVEQVRHLHQVAAAQLSRAGTLDRLLREAEARVAELESLVEAGTEYRVWVPGGMGLYVRRAVATTGFAVLEARTRRDGRRAWTREGWRLLALVSNEELFCWPDAASGVAEARRLVGEAASVVESADALTKLFAPTQALREDDPNGLHHEYRVSRDLPESGGVRDV